MKLALLPSAFHPNLGGIEELVRQVAHELQRRGDDPLLLVNRWPRSLPAVETFEGLPIRRLKLRVPSSGLKAKLSYHLTHRLVRRAVVQLLREFGAELIHVHGVSCNVPYALHAKRVLGLPLVVTLHGELTMDANQIFQRSRHAAMLMRQVLAEADRITAVSAKTLADAEAFCGGSFGARARVIVNGASLEDIAQATPHTHARPYVLAMGRLAPQKGFDLLLRAFADAGLEGWDLLLAGDGPQRDALETLVRELGLTERVHLLGRVDRDRAAALFRGARFFVIPSRADEGMPLVAAEAMGAGCPVIGTRSGGLPELVAADETGFVIEREDLDGLRDAITRMASDEALRARMSEASRDRAQRFAWPAVTREYREVYAELTGAGSAPPVPEALATG